MPKDKRLLVGLLIACLGLFGLLVYLYGYDNTWQLWNIETYHISFLDMRLITGGAESYASGHDPAINDTGDPQHRIFNYPQVWYLILASGINQNWTVPISVVVIALLLISVCVFPGRLNTLSTLLLIFGLFSSAGMFAMNRANVDIIFFSLMTLALVLVEVSAVASFIVLLIGILFKIFPLLGVGYFLGQEKRSAVKYISASVLFTILYVVITLRRMIFIFSSTMKADDFSYGVSVLPAYLRQLVTIPTVKAGPASFYQLAISSNDLLIRYPYLMYLFAFFILLVFGFLGLRSRGKLETKDLRNLRAFWIGAGIYAGTFFIGNNWDYRLIFLLFTLPLLGEWAAKENWGERWVVIATLVFMFLSLWYFVIRGAMGQILPLGKYISALLDEGAKWSLFAALIYLFAASLPDWVIEAARQITTLLLSKRGGQRKSVEPLTGTIADGK